MVPASSGQRDDPAGRRVRFVVMVAQPPAPARNSMAEGTALAVLAAALFGITTPVIRRVGSDADPFSTAMLLYAGATLATLPRSGAGGREATVRGANLPRLAA